MSFGTSAQRGVANPGRFQLAGDEKCPVLNQENSFVALGTARTRSKAYSRIVELMRQRLGQGVKIKVAFTHVAALEKLEMLR